MRSRSAGGMPGPSSSTVISRPPAVRRADSATALVWASAADLGHVLDNLIENALRYCPPGTEITVESAAADGRAALVVSDTGPGIPPAERERIFEAFYRLDRSRDRSTGGFGLGLAIARKAVAAHGGTLQAADSPLGGARFVIALPD